MYAGVEGDAGEEVSAATVDELGNQPAVVFHALPRAHDRSGRGEPERPGARAAAQPHAQRRHAPKE